MNLMPHIALHSDFHVVGPYAQDTQGRPLDILRVALCWRRDRHGHDVQNIVRLITFASALLFRWLSKWLVITRSPVRNGYVEKKKCSLFKRRTCVVLGIASFACGLALQRLRACLLACFPFRQYLATSDARDQIHI